MNQGQLGMRRRFGKLLQSRGPVRMSPRASQKVRLEANRMENRVGRSSVFASFESDISNPSLNQPKTGARRSGGFGHGHLGALIGQTVATCSF
jgi:hypothetical protein